MAALRVHSVVGKGDLQNECIWLSVDEDISSLSYYVLCDTTFQGENAISNELRHVYWFTSVGAKKGDWVCLRTKSGQNGSAANDKGSTTHSFFWNLSRTVWNKAGDAALLFSVSTWNTTRV